VKPVIVGQGYRHTYRQQAPDRYERIEETVVKYLLVTETTRDHIHYRLGTHLGNLTEQDSLTNYAFHAAVDRGDMVLVKDVFVPVHFPNSRLMEID